MREFARRGNKFGIKSKLERGRGGEGDIWVGSKTQGGLTIKKSADWTCEGGGTSSGKKGGGTG